MNESPYILQAIQAIGCMKLLRINVLKNQKLVIRIRSKPITVSIIYAFLDANQKFQASLQLRIFRSLSNAVGLPPWESRKNKIRSISSYTLHDKESLLAHISLCDFTNMYGWPNMSRMGTEKCKCRIQMCPDFPIARVRSFYGM